MNWNSIKKNTPKAFEKLIKWLDCTVEVEIEGEDLVSYTPALPTHHILNKEIMPLRRLFDFFDEHEIYLNVFITENPDNRNRYWDWQVFIDGECFGSSEVEEPTRKEAETAAFKRAFNILEKQ